MPGERSLGWYLEYLLVILPFGKLISRVSLEGATHSNEDISVDGLETLIAHVKYFAKSDDFKIDLKIDARAFGGPEIDANGRVTLTVSPTPGFKAVQFTKPAAF